LEFNVECSGTVSLLSSWNLTTGLEETMLGGLIWWILIGLIAGWLAGKVMKGGGYGVLLPTNLDSQGLVF
jgi:hypothetical protein